MDFTAEVGRIKKPWKVHADAREYGLHTGALWSVDAEALTPEEVACHLKALTCVPHKGKKGGGFAGAAKPFPIGTVRDGRLYMPPHYAVQAFPKCVPSIGTTAGAPMSDAAVYTGSLWETYPPQKQAVAAWAAWQARATSNMPALPGIISLPCGHGKSHIVVATAALHVRRVTLILVHKRPLVPQWRDEIKTYVPGASVGIIIPEMQVVEGVDYIVASLQCLHSHMQTPEAHPYLHALREVVGFVVLDEAHHGVAGTFQYVMARLPAAARLAVTATPRRQDGLFEELQFIFGPVIFQSYRRPGSGQVVMLRYNSPTLVERKQWGNLRTDLMEDDLCGDAERDAVIVSAASILARQVRRVVVVTPRVAHVRTLATKIANALGGSWGDDVAAAGSVAADGGAGGGAFGGAGGGGVGGGGAGSSGAFGGAGGGAGGSGVGSSGVDGACALPPRAPVRIWYEETNVKPRKRKGESDEDHAARKLAAWQAWEKSGPHGEWRTLPAPLVGTVTADMKTQAERQLNYEASVVVATSNMLEEGLSFSLWDSLIDADNSADVEQICGRIQRAGRKKVPLVVDVYSPVSLYVGLKAKRMRFYAGEQFGMHDVEVNTVADLLGADWWARFDRFTESAL